SIVAVVSAFRLFLGVVRWDGVWWGPFGGGMEKVFEGVRQSEKDLCGNVSLFGWWKSIGMSSRPFEKVELKGLKCSIRLKSRKIPNCSIIPVPKHPPIQ